MAITVCSLALLGIWLGFELRRGAPSSLTVGTLGVPALLRTFLSCCLVLGLLLGPGYAIAKLLHRPAGEALGFLVLPGLVLLTLMGLGAWLLSAHVSPRSSAAAAAGAVLLMVILAAFLPGDVTDRQDRLALLTAGALFTLAVGRNLYSFGAAGELYSNTISRTLDARPDMRIPFHVVQLIANGVNPWTDAGEALFKPYQFSSRGPLAGLAAAPAVLLSGATVPFDWPQQPWQPFDNQGFVAYRISVEALTAFCLLLVYGFARRLLGAVQARLVLLAIAVTPFFVHEAFFPWPKLLAAGLVVGAAHLAFQRRQLSAGLLIGVGYLAHPLALLWVPTLGLFMAVLAFQRRTGGPVWLVRVSSLVVGWLRFGLGVAVFPALWRLINGSHYDQAGFLTYFTGPADWWQFRWDSLVSTLLPLWSAFTHGNDFYYVTVPGKEGWSVLLYEQFTTNVEFAIGLTFTPLVMLGLVAAWRRSPALVLAVLVFPLFFFLVYWGASSSGLVREGLHPWLLTLVLIWAWARPEALRRWPGWARWEPWLLAGQALLSTFMILLPSAAFYGVSAFVDQRRLLLLVRPGFWSTDAAALLLMSAALVYLGWRVWRDARESAQPRLDGWHPARR